MKRSTESDVESPLVLLLGTSGFFGPALMKAFGESPTISTHYRNARPNSHYFDATRTSIAELISQGSAIPAAAVILFGITNVDDCARDPVGTARVNVAGAISAIDEIRSLGIVPVYVSSDAVFDGTHPYSKEGDETRPILEYGRQKQVVEGYFSALPPPWLVVRLPKLLAPIEGNGGILNGWIESLGRNEKILCATDQFFTPAAVSDVAKAIAYLIHVKAQGVFHLGGPERLSRRQLLAEVMEEYQNFKLPSAEIVECQLRDIPVIEPRPLDSSLNSSRFTKLSGLTFLSPREVARMAVRNHFAGITE